MAPQIGALQERNVPEVMTVTAHHLIIERLPHHLPDMDHNGATEENEAYHHPPAKGAILCLTHLVTALEIVTATGTGEVEHLLLTSMFQATAMVMDHGLAKIDDREIQMTAPGTGAAALMTPVTLERDTEMTVQIVVGVSEKEIGLEIQGTLDEIEETEGRAPRVLIGARGLGTAIETEIETFTAIDADRTVSCDGVYSSWYMLIWDTAQNGITSIGRAWLVPHAWRLC